MVVVLVVQPVYAAINQVPIPEPKPNSYGLEATKTQPPPDTPPVILTPGGGSSGTSPITVSGTCKDGLLVQVYNNGVLVGAVMCEKGSFNVQITLFAGQNDITAYQYDNLGQSSPVSNTVSVTYNNTSFTAFGALITLTSNYGRRAANPGSTLTWPLQLSGGSGPYAFSIDWGDGTQPELKSMALSGNVEISHIYKNAGIYRVTVRVTDVNGVSAFIQVVAVANGTPPPSTKTEGTTTITKTITKVMWLPTIVCAALLLPTFWLGRRSQLVSLHRKLEKDMANYKEL
jgi:hypothetical protein